MTFTHALATNNYGPAKFIVDASAANGTHTTIAAALTSAASGDVIFIRPGTYTENLTLKAGVNLCSFGANSLINGTGEVIISGKCTMTTAGTVTISSIQLQTNSDFLLAVTGSAASLVNLENCYLNCTNNTGISYTSSSASSGVRLFRCSGDLGTTGIAIHAASGVGGMLYDQCFFSNSGGSSTASTYTGASSALQIYSSTFNSPFSVNATGSFISAFDSNFLCAGTNSTAITTAGTGQTSLIKCHLSSGTGSAISIGSGTTVTVELCSVASTNANAVTGAGTLDGGPIYFQSSGNTQNVTTLTPKFIGPVVRNIQQPCFSAATSAQKTNVTGDGTTYTILFDSVIFDQASNYATGTGIFTAPYTGKYHFDAYILLQGLAAGNTTASFQLVTSTRTYTFFFDPGKIFDANQNDSVTLSQTVVLAAAETAKINVTVSGGTKVVSVGATDAVFSGYLVC